MDKFYRYIFSFWLLLVFLGPGATWWVKAMAQTEPPLLKSTEKNTLENPTSYEDIPDSYLQEATGYADFCQNNTIMRQYHNCECMGIKFLEERLKRGPTVSPQKITSSLAKECRDATEAAAVAYEMCMKTTSTMQSGTDPEKFCECVGNTYAKLIDSEKPSIRSNTIVNFASRARIICENPDVARRLKLRAPS